MTYHVARNSQQLGTFSKEETIARYNNGAILPTDLVWTEGMANWQAASEIFGAPIAPAGGGVSAPATPAPYPAPGTNAVPPRVTGVATPIGAAPGSSGVFNSEPCPPDNKTLAIVATVLSVLTCAPLSLILAIIAIVNATSVATKYNAGDLKGAQSAAKTAKTLSWIAIGILVVVFIFLFVFGIFGAITGAARHNY